MDSQVLVQSLSKVTKEWTKQRKQEERNHQAVLRRDEVMMRSHRMTATFPPGQLSNTFESFQKRPFSTS